MVQKSVCFVFFWFCFKIEKKRKELNIQIPLLDKKNEDLEMFSEFSDLIFSNFGRGHFGEVVGSRQGKCTKTECEVWKMSERSE